MKLSYVLAGALVIALIGCDNKKRQAEQEAFFPDQRRSDVTRFQQQQAANGARADGMLYPRHFDNNELSPLGKQKLSLMLGDPTPAKPLTIYLVNVGAGDQLEKRKQAVRDYLKDSLRPDERVEFVNGTNAETLHPSAETLARMGKLETTSDEGSGGGAAPSGGQSSGGAPGMAK